MSDQKQDYLRICNEYGIPFQDFEAQFCSRCLQPECSRSQSGKTKFEERVANWEDRLFLNPDRMDPSDERFQGITAKKFLTVLPSSPHEIRSDWIDPRTAVEPAPRPPEPVKLASPTPKFVPPKPEPPPASPAPVQAEAQPTEPTPATPRANPPVLANTPNRPKQMIGGASPNPKPVLDPWQSNKPPPANPGEQAVKPGSRIKFGG